VTTPDLTQLAAAERALTDAVAGLTDADVIAPSQLPDWTRGHVLTHLARNADALCNLLEWGRTGVEHPMYASKAARNADIEAGAGRPAAEQRADLARGQARLAEALASYPPDRWSATVRGGATGRRLAAADVPWLRTREAWLHLVDLDCGPGLDVLPDAVATRLCVENIAAFAARDDVPAVRITLTPDGPAAALGGAGADDPVITGSSADLVGWLTGRDRTVRGAAAPTLPAWL
jgi:maleylpyruvate isomerase